MTIEIKRAKTADATVWAELRNKLWPASVREHRLEVLKLTKSRGSVSFLAWDEDRVVGFVEASIRPYANGCDERPVPFLEGLFVLPKYRRKDVGGFLVAAVEAWAMKRGHRELGSDALLANRVSHKAHRAYGFKETERVVYFRKKLTLQKATPLKASGRK